MAALLELRRKRASGGVFSINYVFKFLATSFKFVAFVALISPVSAWADHGVFNPKTFTLSNGMQVVVVSNHRMPVVSHMVWYKAGSADELPGKTGAAHLLEHLMFKGTKNLPSGEFSKTVASVGGSENAFTSLDYTGYYQNVAVEHLETMMTMEADRMKNLVFDPKEVDTERLVVLEERSQRTDNNPSSVLREHVSAALFMNHPYSRPIIGWEHEIRALSVGDLRAFYDKWYAPSNAILVVSGDITAARLKPMAERIYGKIPASPAISRTRPSEPAQKASRQVMLKDARVRQASWSRSYLAPSRVTSIAGGAGKEHSYALEVLSTVIGGGATSQIYRSLVVEQKLAVSAGAGYGSSPQGPSRFSFYASPTPGVSMETLEKAMEREIETLLKDGVAAEKVVRVKKSMFAQAVYARDSLSAGAMSLGSALVSGKTISDIETWPHRIADVTVDQVNAAAHAVLKNRPSVTALLQGEDGK
jgi:zinc protease